MQIQHLQRTVRNLLTAVALVGAAALALPAPQVHAAVFVSVGYAPPAIPYYAQPLCPGDGYLWTPGYWAWGPDGYYWVDGAWVEPPYEDALWTPGWWGWGDGGYLWYPGYWGLNVGYYGGINYGYGYFGTGFYGGYWHGGHFWYNRTYGHFGAGFHGNFYNRTYAGFNGRPGGASFNAHPPERFASARGGEGFHASTVHGAVRTEGFRGNTGVRGTQSFANRGGGTGYNRGAATYNHAQSYNGANRGSYNSPARNYSAPARNSAPSRSYSAPSGGGYHGGGGGGGGHAGGGGGHAGGGHR
jgi:hypothetical protein